MDIVIKICNDLLPSRRGSRVKSDYVHTIIQVAPLKVKSSVAKSLPVENLLPHNVGSVINYLQ